RARRGGQHAAVRPPPPCRGHQRPDHQHPGHLLRGLGGRSPDRYLHHRRLRRARGAGHDRDDRPAQHRGRHHAAVSRTGGTRPVPRVPGPRAGPVPGLLGVTVVVAAFVLLQAANATATSFMTVYVTQSLALDVVWAGIALGTAAGLEIPSLFLMGRLSGRFSAQLLIVTGCALGVVYYLALFAVQTPVGLIGIQVLNAWSFAAIAGTGLTL